LEQRHDRVRHRPVVTRRHEQSSDPIVDDFGNPAGGRSDDRAGAGHGVE